MQVLLVADVVVKHRQILADERRGRPVVAVREFADGLRDIVFRLP